ncbi:MAG: hypothetical protein OEW67_03935 [Cyclobacteriaceae bacterium]|nr:hypothetical protein [Cyclobacteriaceae bacterium]
MKRERIFQTIKSLLPSSSNWRAVLLSIGAATTFWFFNSFNQNYTASISYPVNFVFARENFVIIEPLPEEVQINVSGGGWSIFRKTFGFNLTSGNITLEQPADVKKIVGSGLLPIISEQLKELRVNYIITDTLDINIERKKSRKLAVSIDSVAISLEPNYLITSSIKSFPDSVIVTGPESIINQLPTGLPMAIEETEIDESFDEFVEFKIRGYTQPLLEIEPAEINVQFTVEEFVRFSSKVSIHSINFPKNTFLKDSIVEVDILMRKDNQNDLIQDSIIVEVDFNNLQIDSTILPHVIRYPVIISSIELDTTSIKVQYE